MAYYETPATQSINNSATIEHLMRKGIRAIWKEESTDKAQWKEVYTIMSSDQRTEQDIVMKTLGPARMRAEGAAVEYDSFGEGYVNTITHKGIALGFIVTDFSVKDNLYKAQFSMEARELYASFNLRKEIWAMSIFNNSTNPDNPLGNGQTLLSTAQPTAVGTTFSNTLPIQSDLTEKSIEDIALVAWDMKKQNGEFQRSRLRKLLIPPALQFQAERLLKSSHQVDSANNTISALHSLRTVPEGYTINQYLNSNRSWFGLTTVKTGFVHYQRDPIEFTTHTDPDTHNIKINAKERCSFYCRTPAAVVGCVMP